MNKNNSNSSNNINIQSDNESIIDSNNSNNDTITDEYDDYHNNTHPVSRSPAFHPGLFCLLVVGIIFFFSGFLISIFFYSEGFQREKWIKIYNNRVEEWNHRIDFYSSSITHISIHSDSNNQKNFNYLLTAENKNPKFNDNGKEFLNYNSLYYTYSSSAAAAELFTAEQREFSLFFPNLNQTISLLIPSMKQSIARNSNQFNCDQLQGIFDVQRQECTYFSQITEICIRIKLIQHSQFNQQYFVLDYSNLTEKIQKELNSDSNSNDFNSFDNPFNWPRNYDENAHYNYSVPGCIFQNEQNDFSVTNYQTISGINRFKNPILTVRFSEDPYFTAQLLTHNTLWFGISRVEKIFYSLALIAVGICLLLAPCNQLYKFYLKRNLKYIYLGYSNPNNNNTNEDYEYNNSNNSFLNRNNPHNSSSNNVKRKFLYNHPHNNQAEENSFDSSNTNTESELATNQEEEIRRNKNKITINTENHHSNNIQNHITSPIPIVFVNHNNHNNHNSPSVSIHSSTAHKPSSRALQSGTNSPSAANNSKPNTPTDKHKRTNNLSPHTAINNNHKSSSTNISRSLFNSSPTSRNSSGRSTPYNNHTNNNFHHDSKNSSPILRPLNNSEPKSIFQSVFEMTSKGLSPLSAPMYDYNQDIIDQLEPI